VLLGISLGIILGISLGTKLGISLGITLDISLGTMLGISLGVLLPSSNGGESKGSSNWNALELVVGGDDGCEDGVSQVSSNSLHRRLLPCISSSIPSQCVLVDSSTFPQPELSVEST